MALLEKLYLSTAMDGGAMYLAFVGFFAKSKTYLNSQSAVVISVRQSQNWITKGGRTESSSLSVSMALLSAPKGERGINLKGTGERNQLSTKREEKRREERRLDLPPEWKGFKLQTYLWHCAPQWTDDKCKEVMAARNFKKGERESDLQWKRKVNRAANGIQIMRIKIESLLCSGLLYASVGISRSL